MTISTPPVGARVRHTTTYADGTAVTLAGAVVPNGNHNLQADPHLLIGEERFVGYLMDRPGVYTVSVEVLDAPVVSALQPEPVDGYYLDRDNDVWQPVDDEDPEGRWAYGSLRRHWAALNLDHGPLVRLVPDPADTAPASPWDVEDKDEDSLVIVTSDLVGVAALVSVNSSAVYLAPAAAREAAGVLLRAVREFEERQR